MSFESNLYFRVHVRHKICPLDCKGRKPSHDIPSDLILYFALQLSQRPAALGLLWKQLGASLLPKIGSCCWRPSVASYIYDANKKNSYVG